MNLVVKHNGASADDVVALVIRTAKEQINSKEVTAIIGTYPIEQYKENLYEWLRKVYNLIQSVSTYGNDTKGVEQIKTPERFLFKDKFGDCDDYTTLWVSILLRVKIKVMPKLVKYEGSDSWAHIYAIVPSNNSQYIVLDNVNPAGFDQEVQHTEFKIYEIKK